MIYEINKWRFPRKKFLYSFSLFFCWDDSLSVIEILINKNDSWLSDQNKNLQCWRCFLSNNNFFPKFKSFYFTKHRKNFVLKNFFVKTFWESQTQVLNNLKNFHFDVDFKYKLSSPFPDSSIIFSFTS